MDDIILVHMLFVYKSRELYAVHWSF